MEVNYGYDEYHPDMSLGVPEDLFRAQQYNISADLRCANSNNEKPDWRQRGVSDPWCKNPKFHDPDLQYREERDIIDPLGCRPKHNVINYYASDKDNSANKEGMKSGAGTYNVGGIGEIDSNTLLMLIMFAFVIYIVLSFNATVKQLSKKIKKLQKNYKSTKSSDGE